MFGGLGLVFLALLLLPILIGIISAMFFFSVPRLRFLATYSALIPLAGVVGLIGGLVAGLRLARPYFYRYDYGLATVVWPAWAITIAVMLAGATVGMVSGAFAGFSVNRVARLLRVTPDPR
jgi:hypothetical protein